jgi:glycosyltransferase involved in cell wall biosynthesis
MKEPLKILVSAYACGPNWGSEIGMGWNWIVHLSNYCQLTVITEKGFEKDILEKLPSLNLKYNPEFYFIDIGDKGRKLFWMQGSFLFYSFYKKWQQQAYNLAVDLIKSDKFDIVHQLNMIGFREPGYLWKIKKVPFVWGPVGGYNQIPWSYIPKMDIKNIFFYSAKNIINAIQMKLLSRPKKSAMNSSLLFAATNESMNVLSKYSRFTPILLNETGCLKSMVNNVNGNNETLKILWVGRIQGLKALPIALKALAKVKKHVKFSFTIIGDGPDTDMCKQLAIDLAIENYCSWHGRIPNEAVINEMEISDFLFFTSLKEGTPHVITEAIQNGLPVLCHDACGHGAVITEECGVKIPMISYKNSIQDFGKAIVELSKDKEKLNLLSDGALNRANELTWDSKAAFMYGMYLKLLEEND